MTDEKRLRGEQEHTISPGEISAWHRGKDDAKRNDLLSVGGASVEKVVRLVKLYAELGDVHYLSTKLDMTVGDINKIFASLGINSIEDARKALREGVVGEYEAAREEQSREDDLARREAEKDAGDRLEADLRERAAQVEQTQEEADQAMAEHRDEAIQKNKMDKLRQLISDGIDSELSAGSFHIPLNRVNEFKSLIQYGVSHLQRQFGGSKKDIVREVKRIAPHVDSDMLRP